MTQAQRPPLARFDDLELDLRAGELRQSGGKSLRLTEQPLQILALLLESPGDVVLRDEIRERLWPNDTIVEFDHSINAAMKRLRQALGESAENPRYIETLSRRGYRWKVPVQWLEATPDYPGPAQPGADAARPTAGEGNLIGKKVSHYRVLAVLGGGGMGVVYKAEDLKLGRRVALKFLPEELADDPAALQRFESEARSASALNHPNICTIYGVEEYEGQPFLVMELLEGQTVRDSIAAIAPGSSTLELGKVLDLAVQITAGLEAAHRQGIIHRDIKPANIFLASRGQAKILDFGLAKLSIAANVAADSATANPRAGGSARGPTNEIVLPAAASPFLSCSGVAMGTAGYMSPEQIRGEKLDERTDLFSFGLVLYEMSTGKRAFEGDAAPVLHDAILRRVQSPVRDLNPALPPKFEKIINKALEKDREARYQSASQMHADLETLSHEIERKSAARGRTIAAIAGSVLLFASAASWFLRRPPSSSHTSPDLNFRPLTINTTDNRVISGAISPDGKYLAYSDESGLRVKLIANDQVQAVAQPEELKGKKIFWELGAWFPDSTRFIVNSHSAAQGDSGWISSDSSLWIVSVLGAPPHKLRDSAIVCSVSPDGLLISFGTNAGKLGDREIWLMGPNGEQPRKLFETDEQSSIGGLSWSKDAKRVFYFRIDASGATVLSSDLDGSHATTILPPSETKDIMDLSWLPDGRFIYAVKELNGTGDTCNYWTRKLDLRTGQLIDGPKRLTNWSGFCIDRTTSTSDGKRLSFLSYSSHWISYMGDLEGGGTRVLNLRNFSREESDDAMVDWTADGKAVLVVANRSDHYRLETRSLNSDIPPTIIASGSGGLLESAFYSPDGKWILAQLWPLPGGPLVPQPLLRIPATGGAPESLLTLLPGSFASCSRPPSSQCVIAEPSGDRKQMVVRALDPVKGKGPELARFAVDTEPKADKPARWNISPDGTRLAVSPGPKGPIRILSLRGEPARVILVRDLELGPIFWTQDAKRLLITNFADGGTKLLSLDLEGHAKLLWNCGSAEMCFASPSPDGRRLAIYESKRSSNIWTIENF